MYCERDDGVHDGKNTFQLVFSNTEISSKVGYTGGWMENFDGFLAHGKKSSSVALVYTSL
jgi:hypothetical protein